MTTISLIAAMDEQGGIGKNNQLLCHLPADLQHFKAITMGKPIIMGRKTFESIGKALPGRLNIVISRNEHEYPGVTVVHSVAEAFQLTAEAEEVMILGGGELFKHLFNQADKLYLTVIHGHFDADVFFPELRSDQWTCISKKFREKDEKNAYDMSFFEYRKIS